MTFRVNYLYKILKLSTNLLRLFYKIFFICLILNFRFLRPTERPELPNSLKVLDKSGRSVELAWTSPYDGNSPITRYIVEYKQSKR